MCLEKGTSPWFGKAWCFVWGASVSSSVKGGEGFMAVTFGGPKGGVGYWGHGGGLQGDLSPVEVDRVKGHWRALMQTGSVTW